MLSLSPGWRPTRMFWTSVPELTDCPLSEVTTSPSPSPAVAAGVPDAAPASATPDEPCWSEVAISRPRKAVAPMCTVDEAWPASIWAAMDSAALIGTAKPCVVLAWPELDDPVLPDPVLPDPLPPDPPNPSPNPPNPL